MPNLKISAGKDGAVVLVDCEEFNLDYSADVMLDNGDPIYEDIEEMIMEQMTTLDEDHVEEVVPKIAEEILPYVEKYL